MRIWNRSKSAGCTIWWRDSSRRGTNGWMNWRTTTAVKKSNKKPDADAHFPLCAGLSPAGGHRAPVLASWGSHLVVDDSPTTQHSSSCDHCSAQDRRPRAENPESHNARTDAPRNLRHASYSGRGHETRQNLAPG